MPLSFPIICSISADPDHNVFIDHRGCSPTRWERSHLPPSGQQQADHSVASPGRVCVLRSGCFLLSIL